MKTVGIVGGGMLGITLALRLREKGYEVTLYEAAKEVGGLASAWNMNGVTWDRFYHVILMSDLLTRKIIKEAGLEDELQWVETKTGFYNDGKLYSMSNSLEFLKFPPLNLVDKFRLGLTILQASRVKDWRKLENIPVSEWLKKWSGSSTFQKIWKPLLKAKLGNQYTETSAAFIWATIQRMYAARNSGLKKEMFGYVNGGYARILDKLYNLLQERGITIKTAHLVENVENVHDHPVISFSGGKKATHDKVVLTIPSSFVSKICPGLDEREKKLHNEIQYLGVVCASLLLKKPISPYYVTNITENWVPFTGVIEMSSLVDRKNFNGNSLIYLPKYVNSADPLLKVPDKEVKEIFWFALKKMYPFLEDKDLEFFGVSRAKNVFALSTLNYSQKLPPIKSSIPGLYILNSAHITNGTLNVNETVQLAESNLEKLEKEHEKAKTTVEHIA